MLQILEGWWTGKPWKGYYHFGIFILSAYIATDTSFYRFLLKHGNVYSMYPQIVMQRDSGATNSKHEQGFYDLPDGFKSVYQIVKNTNK
jgi:hypothetical protein